MNPKLYEKQIDFKRHGSYSDHCFMLRKTTEPRVNVYTNTKSFVKYNRNCGSKLHVRGYKQDACADIGPSHQRVKEQRSIPMRQQPVRDLGLMFVAKDPELPVTEI